MKDPTDSHGESATPADAAVGGKPRRQPIGVPRRFAVGTGLIIVTMYSVLFGVMTWLGANPIVFVIVAVFFTGVGAAQMFLFRGTRPRDASFVAGAALCPLILLTSILIASLLERPGLDVHDWLLLAAASPYLALVGIGTGILAGYLAGCLTAGVFFILDRIDKALHGPRPHAEAGWGGHDPHQKLPPSWDERWYDRTRRVLTVLRPYHRGRPIGDAVRLFLVVLVFVGPIAINPNLEWPWWIRLAGASAAGLVLAMLYAAVRLCGWIAVLLFGLLGGAGGLCLNSLSPRVFFLPNQPLSEQVSWWMTALLGCVVGWLVLTVTAVLRRWWAGRKRPHRPTSLRLALTALTLLILVHGGLYLVLLQVSNRPRQRALAAIHRLGGRLSVNRNLSAWSAVSVRMPSGATDEDLEYLWALRKLSTLELHGPHITDAGLAHLEGLPQLEHLRLHKTRVTGSGLRHLRGNAGLFSLVLHKCPVTDEGLASLKHLTTIRRLMVFNASVSDEVLSHLGGNRNLTTLSLSGTQVTGSGFAGWSGRRQPCQGASEADAAMAALQQRAGLKYLNLADTPVADAALAHLGKIVGLRTLVLNRTKVTDAGLQHLKGLTGLVSLSLARARVTDAGLAHLKGLTGLTSLSLAGTQVRGPGLCHLSALPGLQMLELAETSIGDADLVHLKRFSTLEYLDLSETQVTDAGLEHLKAIPLLDTVDLSGTRVSSEAALELERIIQGHVSIYWR